MAAIVGDTVAAVPDDGSVCWSTRSMAARHGVGKDTVARIWRARGLRPWRADVFKLSNDADFEAKLTDVVGLYLDPPERAVVFSFDEKTQVQALDRTQPSLPIKPGRARTMTHDYRRCGTVDLFAALNIATGEVLHQTRKTHTGRDVLAFFARIDDHTPPRTRHPRHLGQPLCTQVRTRPTLAGAPQAPPMAPALHPHQLVVAQPRRGLVLHPHPQGPRQQQLQLRRRPHRDHRHMGPELQRQPPALRLDTNRRRHHRQSQTRTNRPNQNRDGPLAAATAQPKNLIGSLRQLPARPARPAAVPQRSAARRHLPDGAVVAPALDPPSPRDLRRPVQREAAGSRLPYHRSDRLLGTWLPLTQIRSNAELPDTSESLGESDQV